MKIGDEKLVKITYNLGMQGGGGCKAAVLTGKQLCCKEGQIVTCTQPVLT